MNAAPSIDSKGKPLLSKICILICSILISACGLAQYQTSPSEIEIREIGTDLWLNFGATTTEYTRGIFLLYRIYTSKSEYEAIYDTLTGYSTGNSAYSAFIDEGFLPVYLGNSLEEPTLEISDYPTLFSDANLSAGIDSSATYGMVITFTEDLGFVLNVYETTGSLTDSFTLKRNLDGSSGDFYPNTSDSFSTQDADIYYGSLNYVQLYVAFAVFGYNSSFSDGILYSLPDATDAESLPNL